MAELRDLFRNPTTSELELLEKFGRLPQSAQRTRNFEAFAGVGLPHRRVEAWKWSDVRQAVPQLPEAGTANTLSTPFDSLSDAVTFNFDGKGAGLPPSLPRGLRIIEQADGQALGGAEDLPMAALGAAMAAKPGTLMIEVSETPSQKIHLNFEATLGSQFSRIAFVLRPGVKLEVFESHLAPIGFSSHVVEYSLEDGAELQRTIYQRASKSAVQVFTALIHLNDGAHLIQNSLGFGAKLCRNETRVFHHGPGANAVLNAAYLVGDGYHYDQTSHVRHSREDCQTSQLCKGAVSDGGHSIFQGKFYVARKAQKTAAEMSHHALILEDGGEVNAKPELEIYADDVECAHGNTVGALDTEALFYMRQRGMTEADARALLTEAFITETFEDVDASVQDALIDEARQWLRQQA